MSFDVSTIQAAFVGLVGIRPPLDPAYQKLDVSFETSESGLFLDDVEYYKTQYWIDTQDYAQATDADLSTRMGQIRDSSVMKALRKVFNKPVYTDNNKMFSKTFDREKLIVQTGNTSTFYGYEIVPGPEKNLAFKINKCTLEFEGAGDITIQLYNTSKLEPLESQTVTIGAGSSLEEVELNWVINSTHVPYKGTYVLGYFRNDTIQPIDRSYNIGDFMNQIKGLYYKRIKFQDDFLNIDAFDSESDHNGLNFDITTYDDYTEFILTNKMLFAEVVQLQWAITCITGFITSARSNRYQRISKEIVANMVRALEGQKGKDVLRIFGIKEDLSGEVTRLRQEVEKLGQSLDGENPEYLTIVTEQ